MSGDLVYPGNPPSNRLLFELTSPQTFESRLASIPIRKKRTVKSATKAQKAQKGSVQNVVRHNVLIMRLKRH